MVAGTNPIDATASDKLLIKIDVVNLSKKGDGPDLVSIKEVLKIVPSFFKAGKYVDSTNYVDRSNLGSVRRPATDHRPHRPVYSQGEFSLCFKDNHAPSL